MNLNDIIVCITNHNRNGNAFKLKAQLANHFETYIIDSGSDDNHGFDVQLDNVYYTGLFNESVRLAKLKKKGHLLFIASDVLIDEPWTLKRTIVSLDNDIYLWAPSSKGQSAKHCKNQNTGGLRDVNYVEGFIFLVNLELIDFYPVNLSDNKYGYGIDILTGLRCLELNRRCVVDDRIEVYHQEGTGYNSNEADIYMRHWLKKINRLGALDMFKD